jgi:hypothetical protein
MFWDTTRETIEFLFRASARFCLEFRSLTPDIEEETPARPVAPLGQTESAPVEPAALASPEIRKRRYDILKRFRTEKGLATMGDLARRAAVSVTAIQGMLRGDRSRYAEAKLEDFLKLIGVSRNNW